MGHAGRFAHVDVVRPLQESGVRVVGKIGLASAAPLPKSARLITNIFKIFQRRDIRPPKTLLNPSIIVTFQNRQVTVLSRDSAKKVPDCNGFRQLYGAGARGAARAPTA